ncbi:amino acid ABC transporter permease [Microbacterium sp. Au-Mic1]|uniref:amino acid ABC transporter permease n=1 Tax=Microbacterium sp. Au-Mic1 TaxID=2906457 RepID=UPI001E604AC7|nr:amino acid ABC transporter permease [Microbacterium sp. Au-Mic1]MCE4027879.1 amino acid ABC transporter permease [Microbacterium sp. Au-Mic1]
MDALLGNLDLWGQATLNTVLLFLGGGVLALVLGTVVGAMRVSPVPIARGVGTAYVNLIRNTPLTLVFFFFVFGYPKLDLPDIPSFWLCVLALGIYTATYVAEVLRAGINTVPVGQAEAARAIGLSFGQVMTLVIMPQAFRSVVPPMMSVFIALLKNTTIAAGFAVAELATLRATVADSKDRPGTVMEILLWVAVVFIILVFVLSLVQRHFEKKWRIVR